MSRRGGSSSAHNIQLLPFLDILTCTMGALVTLLFAFARYGQQQVATVSDARQEAADTAAAEEVEDLKWRASLLRDSREQTEKDLNSARLELSHLEDHLRRLRQHADEIHRAALALENSGAKQPDQLSDEALAKLKAQIAESEKKLEIARKDGKHKPTTYSIVPYHGPNQTHRQPIYLECREEGVVLEPEGIVFTDSDFAIPSGPANPLAAAIRAAREYIAASDPDSLDQVEPYPLLIVRPNAITQYYVAREALQSFGSQFGYELIGADKKLSFPPPDPRLAELINQVVADARARQQQLMLAAPKRYKHRGKPNFHVKDNGKGIELDGSDPPPTNNLSKNPYAGIAAGRSGGGTGVGQTVGNGNGQGGPGGPGGGNALAANAGTGNGVGDGFGAPGSSGNGFGGGGGNGYGAGGAGGLGPGGGGNGGGAGGGGGVPGGQGLPGGSGTGGAMPGTLAGGPGGPGVGGPGGMPFVNGPYGAYPGNGNGPNGNGPNGNGPDGTGSGGTGPNGTGPDGTGGGLPGGAGLTGTGGTGSTDGNGTGNLLGGGYPNGAFAGGAGGGAMNQGTGGGTGGGNGGAYGAGTGYGGNGPNGAGGGGNGFGAGGGGGTGSGGAGMATLSPGTPGGVPGGTGYGLGNVGQPGGANGNNPAGANGPSGAGGTPGATGGGPNGSLVGSPTIGTPGGGQGTNDGNGGDGTGGNSPGAAGQTGTGAGGSAAGRIARAGNGAQQTDDDADANAQAGVGSGQPLSTNLTSTGTSGGGSGGPGGSASGPGTGQGGGAMGGSGGGPAGGNSAAGLTPSGPQKRGNGGGPAAVTDRVRQVTNANGYSVGGGADDTGPTSSSTPYNNSASVGGTGAAAASSTSGLMAGSYAANTSGSSSSGSSSSNGSSSSSSSGSSSSNSSSSSSSSGGQSGGGSQGDPQQQQAGIPNPLQNLMGQKAEQQPVRKANRKVSLAESRGNDWSLPDRKDSSVGVSRPVVVQCYSDHLVILGDDGKTPAKTIQLGDRTEDSVDELVSGVRRQMHSWGSAGPGSHWRPALKFRVAPDARNRLDDLQTLLAGSGMEISESNKPLPVAGKQGQGNALRK